MQEVFVAVISAVIAELVVSWIQRFIDDDED